jgi:hypothetical protein
MILKTELIIEFYADAIEISAQNWQLYCAL